MAEFQDCRPITRCRSHVLAGGGSGGEKVGKLGRCGRKAEAEGRAEGRAHHGKPRHK